MEKMGMYKITIIGYGVVISLHFFFLFLKLFAVLPQITHIYSIECYLSMFYFSPTNCTPFNAM